MGGRWDGEGPRERQREKIQTGDGDMLGRNVKSDEASEEKVCGISRF